MPGPRPPHYVDLDRDGHPVRGSFRGYHRGRGRIMHGELMSVSLFTDVVNEQGKVGQQTRNRTCVMFITKYFCCIIYQLIQSMNMKFPFHIIFTSAVEKAPLNNTSSNPNSLARSFAICFIQIFLLYDL